jgi:hypothetical protein
VVAVEEYVYLARQEEDPERLIEPDVSVMETRSRPETNHRSPAGLASPIAPVLHTVPVPKRYRQTFLTLRDRQSQNVVTVVELLSLWNKTAGEGQTEYLVKRGNVFCTPAHLVELDLLRGGRRLPTCEPLEPADFYAFLCRKEKLPQVEVYGWTLRQPLPVIPIPLAGNDPDVPLDLQAAFTTTYDRAGYDYALDYSLPVEPAFDTPTAKWARSILGYGVES